MYRLKEFIKEQLVSIPTASRAPAPAPPAPQPTSPPAAALTDDPGALLAGLLWQSGILKICSLYTCKPDLYSGATHVPQVKDVDKENQDARAGGIKGWANLVVGLVLWVGISKGGVGRDFEILYAQCNCALVRFFSLLGWGFFIVIHFFPPSISLDWLLYHEYLTACKIYCTK